MCVVYLGKRPILEQIQFMKDLPHNLQDLKDLLLLSHITYRGLVKSMPSHIRAVLMTFNVADQCTRKKEMTF